MNRLKKLTYIQYIICGLLVIFILGILLSGHAKNVSFETVQQNIVSCEGINTLKKGTARDMRKNLDLDESLFDWSIYYCGTTLTASALTRLTFLVMPSSNKSVLIIFMLFLSMHQRGRRFLWVSSNRP